MAIVNPIDYSGGSGFLQGLKAYGGMQEIQQARMANEQAAAQQEALNAFKSDWQASFGDPQKMSALVAKYPGQMDAIKSGIGFQDEQHQMSLGNAARDLRVAMTTGNPQAVQLAAVKHAGVLNSVGSSVDDITQQFQQDPNGLANIVDAVGLSAMGAKDYYGVQNDRAQRQNDAAKLQEQVRSNKAGEALQARGQDITDRGQDLSYQSSMTGHNLASQRLALDQQEFGLKLQQAQEKAKQLITESPKLSVNMEKGIETAVNNATASSNSADSMSALAQQFRQEKPTTGLFGNANNMFSKLTGSETALRDLRIRQNAIINSQVLKYLPPGPATDRDVNLAREGAPSAWDDPNIVADWLDANARLERRNAQFNEFKSEWMSANGNPGQSRNGGKILGMDIQKGESLGSAVKRYMAQNPIDQPVVAPTTPQNQPAQPQAQQTNYNKLWGG